MEQVPVGEILNDIMTNRHSRQTEKEAKGGEWSSREAQPSGFGGYHTGEKYKALIKEHQR
jgi:hypothetical protein